MKKALLLAAALCQFFASNPAFGQINNFPYSQSFEESFATGTDLLFLPHWWGNEVAVNSRIFKSTAAAQQGNAALAAAPTSSFSADMRLLLNTRGLTAAQLNFWVATAKNGSGTRSSLLQLSFSADGGLSFGPPILVGNAPFANADAAFSEFSFQLPAELLNNPQAVLRWQVERSNEGSGTATTILLDAISITPAEPQLTLLEVKPLSATRLLLTFNLPLNKASAENLLNYSLKPAVPILAATLQQGAPTHLLLDLQELKAGTYSLTAAGILPEGGQQALESTSLDFSFLPAPQFREVVINEIFADPNPKGKQQPQPVVLPTAADAEFVELYNASAKPYQLQDLRLNGGTPGEFVLEPQSYVILVPAGKKALYNQYGPVVEVKGWKSMANSGTQLQLLHAATQTILDSLTYAPAWYQMANKQEGGWSLEQINPNLHCSLSANWHAAADARGASPAAPNSMLNATADEQPARLQLAVAPDAESIILLFDDAVMPGSFTAAQLALEPALPIASVQQKEKMLLIQLAQPLQATTNYSIQLPAFSDCSGNQSQASTAAIVRANAPVAGEVVINEIMYDPETDQPEWIELYNPTDQYLNLQHWSLGLQEKKLKAAVKLSNNLLLMPPRTFLVISTDPQLVQEVYPATPPASLFWLSGMPGLRNSGDTLLLLNEQGQIIEAAAYTDKLHHPLLKTSKGVSLERLDPALSGLLVQNWSSSPAPDWATPGLQNKQYRLPEAAAGALQVSPEVLEPSPDGIADLALIRYQLPMPGLSGTLYIYDASGREIHRLLNNQLLGQEGVLQWNGTNSRGERVRNGYYVVVLSVFGTKGLRKKWHKTIVVSNWL